MYYPDQRYIANLMRIRREAHLPEEAIGTVIVASGQSVDIRNKVARGIIPARHFIIEAAKELGLRDVNALKNLMLVKENAKVSAKDPIAGKDPKRGRRVFAPMDGMVVAVDGGRIIYQELPQFIELEAGVRGIVTKVVEGRMVEIETTGAILQGVWGNGTTVIATMRMEPNSGIDKLARESLDSTYKNEVVITNRPLTRATFEIIEIRNLAGVVAPSMDISLLPLAMATERAIFLTEGFGDIRMSSVGYDMLKEFDSYQVTLNAYQPGRWNMRRPELVINRASDTTLPAPNPYELLKRGGRVKITRDPYNGILGKIIELNRAPQRIANGLRVPIAKVELNTNGNHVEVPLADLEFLG